jgi:hypothetical protein
MLFQEENELSLKTETALMYDAVHLFATALDELDKSQVHLYIFSWEYSIQELHKNGRHVKGTVSRDFWALSFFDQKAAAGPKRHS